MGWLGWTAAGLVLLILMGGILLWRAADTDPAGTLDAFDARFARERGVKLVERAKYGSDPALTYLACPVVVDNLSHEIIVD